MRRSSRGSIFLEACVATLVIGVAFVAVAQLLVIAGHQQRGVDQRRWATLQAANLAERIAAVPWEELTDSRLRSLLPAQAVADRLSGGRVVVEVRAHDEPTAREIRIRIAWRNEAGQEDRPVDLAVWRYHFEGAATP